MVELVKLKSQASRFGTLKHFYRVKIKDLVNLIMGKNYYLELILGFLLVSCSNYQQNALLGDYVQPSACPDGGCVNTDPLPQGLSISSPGFATLNYRNADTYFEFSGECSVGNYSENYIKILKSSGSTVFAEDLGLYAAVRSYNTFDQTDRPRCVKGKYNIVIDKAYFTSTAPMNLQFRMMGCDTDCANKQSPQWNNPGAAQTSVKVVWSGN